NSGISLPSPDLCNSADYIAFIPKPEMRTALRNLAAAFTHYNENHPHSTLGYHSPREYLR
ncbi:integrase core domain-containing protein, partial [Candidatus Erwinia dacicola]